MANGQTFCLVVGVVSELEENRREGAVERDPQGEKSCGNGVAIGGVVVDAQQELSRGLFASAAFAAGCSEGDHGAGSQAREDLLHGDAVRCGVSEAERRGFCERASEADGAELAPSREGVGLRVEEDRSAEGRCRGVGVGVSVGRVRRAGCVIIDNASGKGCFADGWRRDYVPSEG